MVSFVYAQNSLSVESPVEVPQGGTGYIEVKYQFAQENYFANYSFDLYLPEGITLNQSKIVLGDCHSENHPTKYTIGQNEGADGAYYSLAILSNPTTALSGTSDVLVRLAVDVASTFDLNTELEGAIKKIRFASTGGSTTAFDDIKFTIKVVENRITLDETVGVTSDTPTGEQNVLVKRTLKAGNWNTICLPFAMTANQIKEAFPENTVELADFTGCDSDGDYSKESTYVKVNFATVEAIEANHPYLVKVSSPVSEFKVDNVTVVIPEEDPAVKKDEFSVNVGTPRNPIYQYFYNSFVGSYVPGTIVPKGALYLSSNKFYYSTGASTIKAFRGYFDFQVSYLDEQPYGAKIDINIDGESTSINGMGLQQKVEGVYDLSGRKIQLENGDLNKLQKGVYIIDGKKVTIK